MAHCTSYFTFLFHGVGGESLPQRSLRMLRILFTRDDNMERETNGHIRASVAVTWALLLSVMVKKLIQKGKLLMYWSSYSHRILILGQAMVIGPRS